MPGLNLEQIEGVVESISSRHMAVMPERCTRRRHRLSTCTRCLDACPAGAISWDDGPQVDWDACVRCGACATVCPTSALEARSPTNDEIWVRAQRLAQEHGTVGFTCASASLQEGTGDSLIRVGCLARLDESLLLAGVTCGTGAVWLVAGQCDTCPHGASRRTVDLVVSRANALLEALGKPACIRVTSGVPAGLMNAPGRTAGSNGVSRRGLFKTLVRETAQLNQAAGQPGSGAVEPPQPAAQIAAEGLPTALPDKRLMLVGTLERLGRPEADRFGAGENGLWAGLKFTADCTACQMCAFFCPTGALIKAEHEGRVAVVYQPSRCVNCLLCRDICYKGAVLALGEVGFEQIMDGGGEVLCVRQGSAAPWQQRSSQENTAKTIFDLLRQ